MKKRLAWLFFAFSLGNAAWSGTLEDIRERGYLTCGVSDGLSGFSLQDEDGTWHGFDVDYCRALSAAIFGSSTAIAFVSLSTQDRLLALASGEIDVLARNTTWTMSRDTDFGLDFAAISYIDGQGIMVPKSAEITTPQDLDGAVICVSPSTTTRKGITEYFEYHKLDYKIRDLDRPSEILDSYQRGGCTLYTGDISALAARRTELSKPKDHVILPEILSKEPLGPAVRENDAPWRDMVAWVLYALINAEELGVTSENIDEMRENTDPKIQLLLGTSPQDFGAPLGVSQDWAYQAIKAVGNYGEIFERNLGAQSSLGLERGLNRLWKDGGIIYAPPIR